MSVVFQPLQELGPSDLNILITDSAGTPFNPSGVYYRIVYCEPCNPNGVVMPPETRTPANNGVGSYWADMQIPQGWTLGIYEVRWSWRMTSAQPYTSARERFQIVKLNPNRARCVAVSGEVTGFVII